MATDNKIQFEIVVDDSGAITGLKSTREGIKDIDLSGKNATQALKDLNATLSKVGSGATVKNIKLTAKELKAMHNSLNMAKNASGAATSSVMELGRVISDAPYGIRGMANNITQLVSQMGFATKAAGGFGAALKQMWKALMGPLGIVLAITAVVSALDFFFGANKKAEGAVSSFSGAVAKSGSNLKILRKAFQDKTISVEEANRAVNKANGEYKGLNLQLNKNNELTDESVKALDRQIDSIERLAKARALQSLIETEYAKIAEARLKADNELIKKNLTLKDVEARKEEERLALEGKTGAERRKIQRDFLKQNEKQGFKITANFRKVEKEGKDAINSLMAQLSESDLFDELFKTKKGGSGGKKAAKVSPFKVGKELEIDIASNEAAVLAYNKKTQTQELKNAEKRELLTAKTEKEEDDIKKKYAYKFLEIELDNEHKALELRKKSERIIAQTKYDNFQKEANLRFLAYEDSIKKNAKLTDIQKKAAIDSARTDTSKLSDDAFKEQQAELGEGGTLEKKYEGLFEVFNKLARARRDALGIGKKPEEIEEELYGLSFYLEQYKTLASGISDFLQGEADRQLIIEQGKTDDANVELQKRLLNENLSKDEREKIQNEIAQNDEKLRVKQNKIKKKAFDTQKAFNMSIGIADTIVAGIKTAKDMEGAGPIARIVAMTAVIGAGLAQVATIARQKFQPESPKIPSANSGGGGGGGGGGGKGGDMEFNVVGADGNNQLVSAIQSRFDKPLKAYVVARDVTSQQEADTGIESEASLG